MKVLFCNHSQDGIVIWKHNGKHPTAAAHSVGVKFPSLCWEHKSLWCLVCHLWPLRWVFFFPLTCCPLSSSPLCPLGRLCVSFPSLLTSPNVKPINKDHLLKIGHEHCRQDSLLGKKYVWKFLTFHEKLNWPDGRLWSQEHQLWCQIQQNMRQWQWKAAVPDKNNRKTSLCIWKPLTSIKLWLDMLVNCELLPLPSLHWVLNCLFTVLIYVSGIYLQLYLSISLTWQSCNKSICLLSGLNQEPLSGCYLAWSEWLKTGWKKISIFSQPCIHYRLKSKLWIAASIQIVQFNDTWGAAADTRGLHSTFCIELTRPLDARLISSIKIVPRAISDMLHVISEILQSKFLFTSMNNLKYLLNTLQLGQTSAPSYMAKDRQTKEWIKLIYLIWINYDLCISVLIIESDNIVFRGHGGRKRDKNTFLVSHPLRLRAAFRLHKNIMVSISDSVAVWDIITLLSWTLWY